MNRIAAMFAFVMVASIGQAIRAQQADCTVAALQAKAPKGTTITAAAMVPATDKLAAYCRVDGHVTSVGNEVNVRIGLPQNWNGKYYFSGVGGLGGRIGSLDKGLARGYASASTDTGHSADDATWATNRAKEIDYGYRGTHVTAVAGKAVAAAFYAKPVQHAYFEGCSNGGRQAMMEVQRYPDDFDGIIGGHPATGTPMQAGRAAVYQHMLASPDNFLTADAIELVSRATLAACDDKDGLKDGLITDPRACSFNVESLTCKPGSTTDCLTPGQVTTVKKIYGGVKTKDGKTFAYGFPAGHEGGPDGWRAWISGVNPPLKQADGTLAYGAERQPSGFGLMDSNFRTLAVEDDDPAYSWKVFDVDRDLARLKTMTEILSPLDPDLRPFKKSGGKFIAYHAWSDPGISAAGTVAYFEQMTALVGGQKDADSFARLYMVPGMHHCGGGPGPNTFDMLPALEAWVEQGVAPQQVIASHLTDGKVDRTRPLCPHPMVAKYKGTGSIDEAANFVCR
ncbi:MAG: tannase/feruloyl esterase family alpha/beta hydrolase [Acidobacteriota bacterium]